jgi:hypothetical protein
MEMMPMAHFAPLSALSGSPPALGHPYLHLTNSCRVRQTLDDPGSVQRPCLCPTTPRSRPGPAAEVALPRGFRRKRKCVGALVRERY